MEDFLESLLWTDVVSVWKSRFRSGEFPTETDPDRDLLDEAPAAQQRLDRGFAAFAVAEHHHRILGIAFCYQLLTAVVGRLRL